MGSVSRAIRRNKVRQLMLFKGVLKINRRLCGYWGAVKRGIKQMNLEKEGRKLLEKREKANRSNEKVTKGERHQPGKLALR